MKDHNYWTFSERHPLQADQATVGRRVLRLFDRIDDACSAIAADMEYKRIQRTRPPSRKPLHFRTSPLVAAMSIR